MSASEGTGSASSAQTPTEAPTQAPTQAPAAKRPAKKAAARTSAKAWVVMISTSEGIAPGARRHVDKALADQLVAQGHARHA